MKILIIGMHRSGTTMTNSLFELHPDIKKMFNEIPLLKYKKNELMSLKEWPNWKPVQTQGTVYRAKNVEFECKPINFDPYNDNWGQNISYMGPDMSENSWKRSTHEYVTTWNEYFSPAAAVIHIIRHPFDVLLSAKRRWKDDEKYKNDGGILTVDHICNRWADAIENIRYHCDNTCNLIRIRYEDILFDPFDNLKKLFFHCDLDSSDKTVHEIMNNKEIVFFGKINKDRAFSYRKSDEDFEIKDPEIKNKIIKLFEKFNYEF